MKIVKSWTFLIYPESATKDWREGLEASKKGFIISPIHNKDVDEKTGEVKKAHYHIVVHDQRGITFNTVSKIAGRIGGVHPEAVISEEGIKKYMYHEGQEGKAQYSKEDTVYGNGLTEDIFGSGDEDEVDFKTLFTYIRQSDCVEYAELVGKLLDEERYDLLQMVGNKAYAVQTYLRSSCYGDSIKQVRNAEKRNERKNKE